VTKRKKEILCFVIGFVKGDFCGVLPLGRSLKFSVSEDAGIDQGFRIWICIGFDFLSPWIQICILIRIQSYCFKLFVFHVKNTVPIFVKSRALDPDPHLFQTLDPEMDADPKSWIEPWAVATFAMAATGLRTL